LAFNPPMVLEGSTWVTTQVMGGSAIPSNAVSQSYANQTQHAVRINPVLNKGHASMRLAIANTYQLLIGQPPR
jgi:hypothetical protein